MERVDSNDGLVLCGEWRSLVVKVEVGYGTGRDKMCKNCGSKALARRIVN